jgi:hypothetical protein
MRVHGGVMARIRTRLAHAATAMLVLVSLAVGTSPRGARAGEPARLPEAPAPRQLRPPPPRDLVLLLDVASPAGNPFDGADHGWRLEALVERRMRRGRLGSAVVLGGGNVSVPGYASEWAAGITGQARWYALGDFERGLFVGGLLSFWRIGPHLAWAPGPLVGYRFTFPAGLAAEAHLGIPFPVDHFSTASGAGRVPFRDAWDAILPGVFVGVGASLRTGGPLRPRDPPR